ncbi:M23 family metallopeptidase [Spirosoma utsteinense]|uniref:Murein DD-endopeptidase MepM/ murein hydrolase activator NlpD n=1 Tax=Spirosoma utsteinense TaxID=2585773 RepID=A0ABR6W9W1_9BACT|nr:M23 family metallopeptidase [Spirosoma utsteinense]MBC3786063.1 murein DD-endopeptidase MepM/ murein hydrolase activator NlpD [Spirosoma utsteinense]MBC3793350.1 murein DD-endopeptidase MepM/ murein hydrolase activator NlpD [Spirosoma utsteinense]
MKQFSFAFAITFCAALPIVKAQNTSAKDTAPSKTVSVAQGEVARWAGNCQRCSFEKRAWAAVNGTCYYPVDMDMKAGTYTISRRTTGGKLESAKLTVTEKACKQEDIANFPKKEYVNVSAQNLARAAKEAAVVNPIISYKAEVRPAVFDLPVGKPADPLPRGEGNFGACRTFDGQPRDRHTGQDYPVTGGKPVLSVGNGRVVLAANQFFSGNVVFIDHGNGLVTEYFHLKNFTVKPNQTVTKGQKIGVVGETGRVTGPHLHFGVRWHGACINPGFLLIDPSDMPEVK